MEYLNRRVLKCSTLDVPITPSRAWSLPQIAAPQPQDPDSAPQPSLLGLSMRMCEPEAATDNVWHVLDVLEGSPAESAGLVPMGDWILGWYLSNYFPIDQSDPELFRLVWRCPRCGE